MATRSKTTTKTDVSTPSGDPIPAAVRPAAKPSAASLLAGLAGKAKEKPKSNKTKERLRLPLDESVQLTYAEFAKAKELSDIVNARLESLKGELNPELFSAFVGLMWQQKTMPSNPSIEIEEDGKIAAKGMFIVQERFMVQIPDKDDPAGSIANLLKERGLGEQEAEELVENEVDFTPQTSLRAFNELVSGHYGPDKQFVEASAAEKAVGQKLLEFVTNNLSAEEQELVLRNTPKTVVKKDFLKRACGYAKTRDQLASILQVFVPVVQNKGARTGVSLTPVAKTEQLVRYTEQIIGTSDQADEDDDE